MHRRSQDALVDASRRGELREDVDLAVTADCFASAIVGSRSFGALEREQADRISGQLVEIFTRGISLPR